MNFNVDAFNYITGVATLVGLFFQFKDLFPEHRETRKTVVVLVTGIFIGTLLSTARGIKVDLSPSIQPTQIVVVAIVFVLVIACVIVMFTKDQARQNNIYPLIGFGTLVLLGILFAQGLSSTTERNSDQEQKQISLEEIMQLANTANAHGDYQRALLWLEAAQTRVVGNSEQFEAVKKREQDIRNKQLGEN